MKTRTLLRCALATAVAVALAGPAWAGEPITATFWYSYGGKVRQVTEEMVKKFNGSQTKYRIDGSFQGARAVTRTPRAKGGSTASSWPGRPR